jgi:hypothetical protein
MASRGWTPGIALLCFAYLEELNKQSGAELSSKGDLPNIWHTDIECVKWGTYVLLHNMWDKIWIRLLTITKQVCELERFVTFEYKDYIKRAVESGKIE